MSEGAASVPAPERQRGSRRLYFPTYRGLLLQSDPAECIGWERVLIIGSRFFSLDDEGRAQRIRVVREADSRISTLSRRLRERGIANAIRNDTLDVVECNPRNPFVEMLAIRTGIAILIACLVGMIAWLVVMMARLFGALSQGPAYLWPLIVAASALNIGSLLLHSWPVLKSLRRTIPRSIRYTSDGVIVRLHHDEEVADGWAGLKLIDTRAIRLVSGDSRWEVRLGAVGRVIAKAAIGVQIGETRKKRYTAWRRRMWRVWTLLLLAAAAMLGVIGYLHWLGAPVQQSAPWAAICMLFSVPALIEAVLWINRRTPRMRRKWRRWWMSGRPTSG